MTRTRIAVSLALSAALALTGCGAAASSAPDGVAAAPSEVGAGTAQIDVAAEAVALEAAGFASVLTEAGTSPAPSASAGDKQRVRPRAVRKLLRKNTLHGEVVVQGRDGERTIVVQRGAVTAADDRGFTVKSTDGFTVTWSYGDPLKVVQNREKATKAAVRDGVTVAVGGIRDGAASAARLVIVG